MQPANRVYDLLNEDALNECNPICEALTVDACTHLLIVAAAPHYHGRSERQVNHS